MTDIEIHEDGGAAVLIATRDTARMARALRRAGFEPHFDKSALLPTLRISCEARQVHAIRDEVSRVVAELGGGA